MKKYVLAALLLTAALLGGCSAENSRETSVPKETIELNMDYPALNLEEICEQASAIVHGTVTAKQETFLYNISLDDEPRYRAYTPYTVEVETWYKGDNEENETTYLRTGGETSTTIYESPEPDFAPGSEVILFLSETGASWPVRGAYLVEDGMVQVLADMAPDQISKPEDSSFVEMTVSEFEKLILDTLSSLPST